MFGKTLITFDSTTGKYILEYLQSMLSDFFRGRETFGADDRVVQNKMHELLACKTMAENLLGVPINLQKDDKVTIGF